MVVYSPLLKLQQSVPLGHRYWFFTKRLTWSHFILSIKDTCTQTTSIFFIVVSASILVGFLALNGMEPSLGGIVEDADVSLWLLMVMIAGVYLLLGMFLDPLGIMVLALTIGLNVFVIASVTKPSVAVYEIFMGVARFLTMDVLVLITILSLLLPKIMM